MKGRETMNYFAAKKRPNEMFTCVDGKITMPLSARQQQLLDEFKIKKEAMMAKGKTVVPTMAQEHGFSK